MVLLCEFWRLIPLFEFELTVALDTVLLFDPEREMPLPFVVMVTFAIVLFLQLLMLMPALLLEEILELPMVLLSELSILMAVFDPEETFEPEMVPIPE